MSSDSNQANVNKILQVVIHEIKKAVPNLIALYRFGSFATDYQTTGSDLDMAFLADKPLDNVIRWNLAQKIASLINRDVDLIDLFEASVVMRFQIIGYGTRIYCQEPSLCDNFECLVYSMYQRLHEERKDIIKDIQQRAED